MATETIVEMIRRQKAEREALANKPATVATPDIDLRGSGLTQKVLAKQQSQINREEKAAIKSNAAAREAVLHEHEMVDANADQMEKDFIKGEGIVFDDSQEDALDGLLHNQYAVLIGPAGSGKTTITKEFVRRLLLTVSVSDVVFCAFTGRACQQIRRALPVELHKNVQTIHSLLEYAPEEVEVEIPDPYQPSRTIVTTKKLFRPQRTATYKLRQKIIIMDESGMTGVNLWNELIDACEADVRIILIGDIHQLPPVMDKSILGYAMNHWPVFELRKIHRQKEGNSIIDNAHRVLKGETLQNAKNFHLIGGPQISASAAEMQMKAVNWLNELYKRKLFDPNRDAFIVPQNKSLIGQEELNPHLLMLFNPPRVENGIIVNKRIDIHTGTDRKAMAIGDKVMCINNINDISPPITNGMIGIVTEINLNGKYDNKRSQFSSGDDEDFTLDVDETTFSEAFEEMEAEGKSDKDKDNSRDQRQSSHVMHIRFENGQTLECSTSGAYRRIVHSYAITCHKAQGGEYPNVVILLHSANHMMLYQEWLYTAITRARENVYIFYNGRGMKLALDRQKIKGKTLQEKIRSYNIEAKTDVLRSGDTMPILWEPRSIRAEVMEAMGDENV